MFGRLSVKSETLDLQTENELAELGFDSRTKIDSYTRYDNYTLMQLVHIAFRNIRLASKLYKFGQDWAGPQKNRRRVSRSI